MATRPKLLDHAPIEIPRINLFSLKEEVIQAVKLARHKRNHWRVVLAYPVAVESVLDAAVEMLEEPPSWAVARLRASARAILHRKTEATRADYMRRVEDAAEALATADVDGNAVDTIGASLVKLPVHDAAPPDLRKYIDNVNQTGHAHRHARNAFEG